MLTWLRCIAALVLLAGAMPAATASGPAFVETPTRTPALKIAIETLERAIPSMLATEKAPGLKRVPGLSIAVVDRGTVAWLAGYGTTASKVGGVNVTSDTIFEAASLSKPVTALAALRLVDDGKLALDTPLATYVTYADLPDDPRARAITARHVLSHTTGFPNWRQAGALRIFFEPGNRFSYSGEGYVYLQRAIEAITKEAFDATVHRLVFQPLGMSRSSFLPVADDERAKPHTDIGSQLPPRERPDANAAASLRTTVSDYGRLLAAVMAATTGLKPETATLMLSAQVQLDPSCIRCTERPVANRSNTVEWGLGWGLERGSEGAGIWHWGDNPGFKCYVAATLDARRGVVFFTNSDAGLSLRNRIVDMALGGSHPAHDQVKYEQLAGSGGGVRQ
jgi:CubicO group peptidase (beta-lactamase class C family)